MSVYKIVVLVFLMFKCSVGIDSKEALLDRIDMLERLMSEDRKIFLDKISVVQNELYSTKRDLASLRRKFETAEKSKMVLTKELYKSKEDIKECKEDFSDHADDLRNTKQELQFIKERLIESNILPIYNEDDHGVENDFHNKSGVNDGGRHGKHKIDNLKRIVPVGTQQGTPGISFYARAKLDKEHLGIHHPILFENVVTNDGNGYDSNTGTFKAPKAGTYAFSVTIMSFWTEDVTVEMVKNGQNEGSTYCGNGDAHAVCGLTMVIHMEVGDDLWVRITDNIHNTGNIRIHGGGYSSLSGFLIY